MNIALAGFSLLLSPERRPLAPLDPQVPVWVHRITDTSSNMTGNQTLSPRTESDAVAELDVCPTYVSVPRSNEYLIVSLLLIRALFSYLLCLPPTFLLTGIVVQGETCHAFAWMCMSLSSKILLTRARSETVIATQFT